MWLIKDFVGLSLPSKVLVLLAALFALLNYKDLPLVYHLRLARVMYPHWRRRRLAGAPPCTADPARLFRTAVCRDATTLCESDYNRHKANSSYFADLDLARTHVTAAILARYDRAVRARLEGPDASGAPAAEKRMPCPALGAVSCHFRRELKPYRAFEIWSRVLAWDAKWLYIVSHVVRAGAVRLGGAAAATAAKVGKPAAGDGAPATVAAAGETPHPAVLATSVARYVFKEGRRTVPPAVLLEACWLLPPRPAAAQPPDAEPAAEPTEEPAEEPVEAAARDSAAEEDAMATPPSDGARADPAAVPLEAAAPPAGAWDWAAVERERVRGMRAAGALASLESAHLEFGAEATELLKGF